MAELLLLREIAVLIAGGAAAYSDFKTGYIYDRISLPLIGFGVLANLFEMRLEWILFGAIIFAIGYVFYITGKFGGGDVKLFTGIALALPFYGGSFYMLNVLLFAALSATVFYSAFYLSKYFRKGADFALNRGGMLKAGAMLMAVAAYFYVLSSWGLVNGNFVPLFGVPVVLALAFIAFEKGIKKEFFLKKIKIKEMEEDEIIAYEFLGGKEKKIFGEGFRKVFGEKDAQRLEKLGVKEVLVFRDLPRFGPFIFFGMVLALAFPQAFIFFA